MLKGERVESLESAQTGDLVFYGRVGGKIGHVGILFNSEGTQKLFHAKQLVRFENLGEDGVPASLGKGREIQAIRRVVNFEPSNSLISGKN